MFCTATVTMCFPTTVLKVFLFSTFSAAFLVSCLFCGSSNGCDVISHCILGLHFSDGQSCCLPVYHLFIFSRKMPEHCTLHLGSRDKTSLHKAFRILIQIGMGESRVTLLAEVRFRICKVDTNGEDRKGTKGRLLRSFSLPLEPIGPAPLPL